MSSKKKSIIFVAIVAAIVLAVSIANQQYTTKLAQQTLYEEALTAYNSNQYIVAQSKLEELPVGYEERDSMLEHLTFLSETYESALTILSNEKYDLALETLTELPLDYRDTEVLIENMWKLEILTSSTWGDSENNSSESTWIYLTEFSVYLSYSDELKLYLSEDEYSKTTVGDILLNEYKDTIDVIELLETDQYYVESKVRDNFTIDISTLSFDRYTVKTAYFTVTYLAQD